MQFIFQNLKNLLLSGPVILLLESFLKKSNEKKKPGKDLSTQNYMLQHDL